MVSSPGATLEGDGGLRLESIIVSFLLDSGWRKFSGGFLEGVSGMPGGTLSF